MLISPEIMGGSIMPNIPNYPKTGINYGLHLNIGYWHPSYKNNWSTFYNSPYIGVQIGHNSLGNKEIFGHQFSILPFIRIPIKKSFEIKLAYGIAYYTKYYNVDNNPENLFIGASLSWAFNLFIYKKWYLNNNMDLLLGAGFMHGSNGHIQLPNFGINSGVMSLALRYFPKGRELYLIIRQGVGTHELGGTINPIGGKNRIVSATGINMGWLFKRHILLRTGITYKQYRHYYHYIKKNKLEEYLNNSAWSSSALTATLGVEFLIGHCSMDIEGGINLVKPFFKTHYTIFENKDKFDEISKRLIAMRMGINLYAINTNKLPKHNLRIGAYINANMGQADYSELSVSYVRKLGK